ncbi:MAG: SRPBCC domain-containing protein [Rhodothermaceae bacterium]|nr:SRPBCC domain-containing protein [Rhodothermaceae bacterium]MYI84309.1 SRPBCC domain-containing protein [Rhodothermaceae bacterium]
MGFREYTIRTDPIEVNASDELVWGVLTNKQQYGEWNPFTSNIQTDFKIGSPVHLLVRMGPAKFRIIETLCAFDKPRLIAWEKKFGAHWLLFATREQHIEPIGDSNCRYYNVDMLSGLLAPIVYLCFGNYMRRGFRDVATGLKAFMESRAGK